MKFTAAVALASAAEDEVGAFALGPPDAELVAVLVDPREGVTEVGVIPGFARAHGVSSGVAAGTTGKNSLEPGAITNVVLGIGQTCVVPAV
jgi:hypothetical protein